MELLHIDAIVYVVDSADTDRIPIAKKELMAILNVLLIFGCVLLFFILRRKI